MFAFSRLCISVSCSCEYILKNLVVVWYKNNIHSKWFFPVIVLPYPRLFSNLCSIFLDCWPCFLDHELLSVAKIVRNIDSRDQLFVVHRWRTSHCQVKPPCNLKVFTKSHAEESAEAIATGEYCQLVNCVAPFMVSRHKLSIRRVTSQLVTHFKNKPVDSLLFVLNLSILNQLCSFVLLWSL